MITRKLSSFGGVKSKIDTPNGCELVAIVVATGECTPSIDFTFKIGIARPGAGVIDDMMTHHRYPFIMQLVRNSHYPWKLHTGQFTLSIA